MIIMYTDGSYNKSKFPGYCGYSAIILYGNDMTIIYGGTNDKYYSDMWNVGGELLAVIMGLNYIEQHYNTSSAHIYHDYIGISNWVNGKWSAKKEQTKDYFKFIKESQKKLKIIFSHVKGHSGDKYNEIADIYAKKGLELSSSLCKDVCEVEIQKIN